MLTNKITAETGELLTPPANAADIPAVAALQDKAYASLLNVVGDRKRRPTIGELSGDEAQLMADYLDLVLREAGIPKASNRRYILSCLFALAKKARVYPQYYELKGITREIYPGAFGGYADVYRGKFKDQSLCIKAIRIVRDQQAEFLTGNSSEIVIWAHLAHPNILRFYGVYTFDAGAPQLCLVSPWMEGGNLNQYLERRPEVPRMPLVLDVAKGVLYLHRSKIVHSDLKSENVLMSDEGRALIGDFGISSVVTSGGTAFTESPNGTARWKAPELHKARGNLRATQHSDIWSLGCLFYKILTRKIPFHEYRSDTQVFFAFMDGRVPVRPLPGVDCDGIDDKMWGLLERCWDYAPHRRPRSKEIRDFVANLHFEDDRPSASGQAGNNGAFWKAIRARSDVELDYEILERILLRIQQEP